MSNNTHITNHYGVNFLNAQHKDLRQLKNLDDQPSIHGNKFWGSTYLLMDYLQKNPLEIGANVLEIGCGWGLGGIFCAKTFKANVTAIDADPSVFPYLQRHAEHNDVHIQTHSCYFNEITEADLACFDVIIGADICFWDELADEVLELVEKACDADVKKILISDPERPPFFELAETCMAEFYGELLPYAVDEPKRTTGAILVIENA
ncbi:class I SAM-dependent methyltransferase [Dasania marina]|uniref:class I SAM-dependent methyltransferase n=1 Tax=Dasania marina TaxID=471499 RepID=UPI0003710666|nr:methyltransferase domain-containing protein [Dasania marina]